MPWISSTNERICKKQLAEVRKHWATYSKFCPPTLSHWYTFLPMCTHTNTRTSTCTLPAQQKNIERGAGEMVHSVKYQPHDYVDLNLIPGTMKSHMKKAWQLPTWPWHEQMSASLRTCTYSTHTQSMHVHMVGGVEKGERKKGEGGREGI